MLGSALAGLALPGCEGGPGTLEEGPFGQTGQIQVEVRSPFGPDHDDDGLLDGRLDEILIWASNGPWLLTERVGYNGTGGAETIRSSVLNPGELAREYGSLIQQLNDTPGLRLLDGAVSQELDPECGTEGLPGTEVIFTIRDELREEEAQWTRCAEGTLLPASAADPGNLIEPGSAAPDAGAARVITAAQLAKAFTLGDALVSTHKGTHPFGALEQGETSPARRDAPEAFVSVDGEPPPEFVAFWEDHAGPEAPLPAVRWDSEIVFLLAVGLREEAGGELRVRRVLPLGPENGTRVEVIERVPGDFCSPAAKDTYPYQIVVVPREGVHFEIDFTDPQVERIACGT